MDHLADSAAEVHQGGKDWYVGWQGIPMNNCPWEKCEHPLSYRQIPTLKDWESVCMEVDVCILIAYCPSIKGEVLGCGDCNKVICDLAQHYKWLSMGLWSRGRQFRSSNMAVTQEV